MTDRGGSIRPNFCSLGQEMGVSATDEIVETRIKEKTHDNFNAMTEVRNQTL